MFPVQYSDKNATIRVEPHLNRDAAFKEAIAGSGALIPTRERDPLAGASLSRPSRCQSERPVRTVLPAKYCSVVPICGPRDMPRPRRRSRTVPPRYSARKKLV